MKTKKLKVEIEFDRDEVAMMFLLITGKKITDKHWEKLTEETPISVDLNAFPDQNMQIKMAFIALVLASTAEKFK